MKKTILAAGVAALVFTACGGGDDDSDDLTNILMASAEAEGITADRDCVEKVSADLSDEDAGKLIESNGDLETADLTPEGFSTATGLLNCIDTSEVVDQAIADLRDQGLDFDEQCVRDAFEGVDFSEFTSDGGIPEDLTGSLLSCVDIGG